jgi:hypothetical protein
MRAGGASWPAVGKAVGRSAATVGRWPCFYAARWAEYLAEASTDLLNEAAAESLLVLRRQLRSKSELASRDAAGKIIRFHTATRAKDQTLPAPLEADGPVRPSVRALSEYLEGMSDAEFAHLSAEDWNAKLAALVAAKSADGGGPQAEERPPADDAA